MFRRRRHILSTAFVIIVAGLTDPGGERRGQAEPATGLDSPASQLRSSTSLARRVPQGDEPHSKNVTA